MCYDFPAIYILVCNFCCISTFPVNLLIAFFRFLPIYLEIFLFPCFLSLFFSSSITIYLIFLCIFTAFFLSVFLSFFYWRSFYCKINNFAFFLKFFWPSHGYYPYSIFLFHTDRLGYIKKKSVNRYINFCYTSHDFFFLSRL